MAYIYLINVKSGIALAPQKNSIWFSFFKFQFASHHVSAHLFLEWYFDLFGFIMKIPVNTFCVTKDT